MVYKTIELFLHYCYFLLYFSIVSFAIDSVTPELTYVDTDGKESTSSSISVIYNSHIILNCKTVAPSSPLRWAYAPIDTDEFIYINQTSHISITTESESSTSLRLSNVDFQMTGVYQCTNGLASKQIQVFVYGVLSAHGSSALLTPKHTTVGTFEFTFKTLDTSYNPTLSCTFKLGAYAVNHAVVRWKGGKYLDEPDLYKLETIVDDVAGTIQSNLTLKRLLFDTSLYGRYYCILSIVTAVRLPVPVNLNIPPLIEKPELSVTPFYGSKYSFVCNVVAYPPVAGRFTWTKNGSPLSVGEDKQLRIGDETIGEHIHVSTDKEQDDTITFNDIKSDDRAVYSCFISGALGNDTAAFFLRVKDRYAIMWPLVGLILEVIILFVVIMMHEIKQRKKAKFEAGNDAGYSSTNKPATESYDNMRLRQRANRV